MKRHRLQEPPFGMNGVKPAFERATWLAKTLFDVVGSAVVLVDGHGSWRSRDNVDLPDGDPPAELVIQTGKALWVEDAAADPRFANHQFVRSKVGYRFYAAAPLRLADGTTPGVLCVVGSVPRPMDERLAKALQKLADGVAIECDRARAAERARRDITEHQRTRQVLHAFAEAMPGSLVMTDREFRVIKASPVWLTNFNVTEEEAIGRTVFEIAPDYFIRFRGALEKVMGGRHIRDPKVKSTQPGQMKWITAELSPWRDEAGEIGGIIIAAQDITEMVLNLERAERAEQMLNMALAITDIHAFDIDYENKIVQKSNGDTDLTFFGEVKTFEQMAGFESIDSRDRARARQEMEASEAETGLRRAEYRTNRRDGKEVWVSSVVQVARNEQGAPARAIGAMQDITARKQNEIALVQAKEQAEAANQAKSTFLAIMSHEIRTPLNGVLGMAQAMAVDTLNTIQRQRLDVIRQSGETLLAILNDVLDLSKIEAGKLELEEAEFNIDEVARGAHAAFTAIAQKKGLSFDLSVEEGARGVYLGDSTRVRQIVYNLVSNALKFTEEGQVRVVVSRADDSLTIKVSDTGMGIAPDRLAHLFEKFEQEDASTTRRFGGTGLGLAICRELASLMNGSISAESTPGKGSTFSVVLPLRRVGDAGAPAAPVSIEEPQDTDLNAPALRILAAEDNTVNQLVLKTLLHQIGVDPTVVDNGVKALEAWEAGEWDVILMDVQMPELDGPSATRLIRQREAATGRARTPIIALTANAMSHQVAEYTACGMDGFVAKPIEIGRLFTALQSVLGEAASEDQAQVA